VKTSCWITVSTNCRLAGLKLEVHWTAWKSWVTISINRHSTFTCTPTLLLLLLLQLMMMMMPTSSAVLCCVPLSPSVSLSVLCCTCLCNHWMLAVIQIVLAFAESLSILCFKHQTPNNFNKGIIFGAENLQRVSSITYPMGGFKALYVCVCLPVCSYRVAQNKIPHQTMCNISATSSLIF